MTSPDWNRRRALLNNLGLGDMTIAMAAVSQPGLIITVSDARLSHGEAIPADDTATMKNRRIAHKWGMMFAAEDSTAFIPVLSSLYSGLSFTGDETEDFDPDIIRKAVQVAYESEFNERFFREHLARFGYPDIVDFRSNGFQELGKELYGKYADSLARFDLGLELLVYGFSKSGGAHILEVANPGRVFSHKLRGYAAIGSGSLMATAALARRPLVPGLTETIYRLLDAKFSSETARDVGQKTHVITLSKSGKFGIMSQKDVENVREIWRQTMKNPDPKEALDIIDNSKAVTAISDGPA
jgi:hypothetical protein